MASLCLSTATTIPRHRHHLPNLTRSIPSTFPRIFTPLVSLNRRQLPFTPISATQNPPPPPSPQQLIKGFSAEKIVVLALGKDASAIGSKRTRRHDLLAMELANACRDMGIKLVVVRRKAPELDSEIETFAELEFAAETAVKLKADHLILLTGMPGVLSDVKDNKSIIPVLDVDKSFGMIQSGKVTGQMALKLKTCLYALKNGVAVTHITPWYAEDFLKMDVLGIGVGTKIMDSRYIKPRL